MKKAKAQKPKSSITIHKNQANNPIIKDFHFMYQFSNDIPCHFQIDSKYYCYYLSLRYHEKDPMCLSSMLQNTCEQTNSKPRFLLVLFDYVFPREESSINAFTNTPLFQINANLFNLNNQSDILFTQNKDFESLSLDDEKIEKMILDINMICFEMNVCFLLCFSGNDVAQYIYLLSMLDNDKYNASKKGINIETNKDELIESLCYIDLIKKKDANNLLKYCEDITGISLANKSALESIPKLNEEKLNSIIEFFNYELRLLSS